jgi:O-antigen ligase
MDGFRQYAYLTGFGLLYLILTVYFILSDHAYYAVASAGLLVVYTALFHTEFTFVLLGFFTPFSVNIEEYVDGFGLFIPTEPVLLGLMLLLVFKQTLKNQIDIEFWRHPLVWAIVFYVFWILVTSITSTHPVVSFKFLLAKLWFIIPLIFFGHKVFSHLPTLRAFLWMFTSAMVLTILYTLVVHASYNFGEEEGHWVMWPFFKDHTIYGAAVALVLPIPFGLLAIRNVRGYSPVVRILLLLMIAIIFVGLFFSYTRAAWISVILSFAVYLFIRFKVRFQILVAIGAAGLLLLYVSWDSVQMELERNKYEHTTEEFGERLQSATNVTTDASNLERLNRWDCAIEMFQKKPFFGYGPGTYAFEYASFQDPENLTIISTNFGDMGNAHSEYLGPLSESGLFGMLSMLTIVALIFYKSITLYIQWPKEDKEVRYLLLVMILSLVTYFVHGILNNYLDTDKAAVPVWSFCAAFIGLEIQLKRRLLNEKSTALD